MGEPQPKRRMMSTSAAPSGLSAIDAEAPSTVGIDDTAIEDALCASVVETVLSVCLQVDLFNWMPVENAQGTLSTYI